MEPAGPTKVSRRDDGTLTIRALLVKARRSRFLARLDRAGQAHTSVYVRYAPITAAPWVARTKYRRVSRLSASTIVDAHKSACANAEACPLNA